MSLHDDKRLLDGAKRLFASGRSFSWNLVSTRLTQFPYFDELLGRPVWKCRKILDFGGNVGTFLASAGDNVDHEDYWCIDLNPAVRVRHTQEVEGGSRRESLYPRVQNAIRRRSLETMRAISASTSMLGSARYYEPFRELLLPNAQVNVQKGIN